LGKPGGDRGRIFIQILDVKTKRCTVSLFDLAKEIQNRIIILDTSLHGEFYGWSAMLRVLEIIGDLAILRYVIYAPPVGITRRIVLRRIGQQQQVCFG
jgi:hypothetical protein